MYDRGSDAYAGSIGLCKCCFVEVSLVDDNLLEAVTEIKWREITVAFANFVEQVVDP